MIELEDYDHEAILASVENPYWVVDDTELARLCAEWAECSVIGLDTEFIRTDTYYPIPGLIQLSDHRCCYLIDPLSIKAWDPFRALLQNPEVIKVLHSPGEDLEVFRHSYSVMPTPMLDTQLAASFVGWGYSLGLQRLLRYAFDVELAKGETRSNWLQRPLTSEQEHYAAMDVAYLPKLAEILLNQLESLERLAWIEEDISRTLQQTLQEELGMQNYYLRFSQLSGLSPAYQAALRDLSYWRELKVRELNQPRTRFVPNQLIVDIMQGPVRNLKQLSELPGVKGWIMGKYGDLILGFLQNGDESAERSPPELIPMPLSYAWHLPAKALMKEARAIADKLDIPVEILARKRDVEALIRNFSEQDESTPLALQGWRDKIVAEPLKKRLIEIGNRVE